MAPEEEEEEEGTHLKEEEEVNASLKAAVDV
jgi:hypothetical protein